MYRFALSMTAPAGAGPIHIHIAEAKEVQDCLAWSG